MTIPFSIAANVRERITNGSLAPGDPVESTRVVAQNLGVSRGSVVTAYEQLIGEGYLVADRGGTRVNPTLPAGLRARHRDVVKPQPVAPPDNLRPGVPDVRGVTSTLWRSAFRRAAAEPQSHPVPGSWELRLALAEHLRLTRSVDVDPNDLLVTAGARDGLRQLLGAVEGVVAVEDPGFPTLHQVPTMLGRTVVTARIDEQGIRIDDLEKLRPHVVVVAPNHQYPVGTQMSAVRRFELVEWAQQRGVLIVEDDYDSELRGAHPALVALDPGGPVAMLGSFAKTLTPAVGLGYLVVPDFCREEILSRATPVSGIVQDAMTNFLAADGLRRHTSRMRREYDKRRRMFSDVFPEGVAMAGGLHAVVNVRDEEETVRRAQAAGFGVAGLGQYWSRTQHGGIVLGLGTHSGERLRTQLTELRTVLSKNIVATSD